MLAVRSTHSLEAPVAFNGKLLVDVDYVTHLVELANAKMAENLQRIDRFMQQLRSPDRKMSAKQHEKTGKVFEQRHLSPIQASTDTHEKTDAPTDYLHFTDNILSDLFS